MSDLINIELESLPNQSLTIRLSDYRYEIRVTCISKSLMAITIIRGNEVLVQGQRITPGVLLLPEHMAKGFGNFVFITPDETYPYYTNFNADHQFYFIPEG